MKIEVTVSLGSRTVRLDDVADGRIRTALQGASKQVAAKLEPLVCPTHQRGPKGVKIHFDRNGAADLKYDSCCSELGDLIGRALG